nr:hypothetical protein [Tanacetum cinerariifolium]
MHHHDTEHYEVLIIYLNVTDPKLGVLVPVIVRIKASSTDWVLCPNYGGSRHQYSYHGTILSIVTRKPSTSVVKLEIRGNVNFEIKSQFMRELREDTFFGNKNDNAHDHVDRILDIVSLFNIPGVSQDTALLRMFPFTLIRSAKRWVDRHTPGAVNTWDLLKKAFIQRYCHHLRPLNDLKISTTSNWKAMNRHTKLGNGTMVGVDINTLTMVQYLALSQENQARAWLN